MNSFFDALRKSPIKRGPKGLIGGVCAGIAAKFGWEVLVVRIVMLALILLPVLSIPVYVALWVLLPNQDGKILAQSAVKAIENRKR